MTYPLSDELKQDLERYKKLSLKLINDLIREGKYNPFYERHIQKINNIMDYASKCVESHNAFYFPLQKQKDAFFSDLKKYDMSEEQIINIELASIFHNIFKAYAIIELSLDVFLDGVIFSEPNNTEKSRKIKGTETLGTLKTILNKILPNSDFFWDEIDVQFRNAIAHGSYFVDKSELMYYTNSKFEKKSKMSLTELYYKSIRLNLMSIAITGAVRRWDRPERNSNYKLNN